MINIISLIAGAISLIVVLSVVVLALSSQQIPDVLANWGGIILGFYFGQFINVVKDYMSVIQTSSDKSRP
jgi:glycopeptide antibiotics resistance protein